MEAIQKVREYIGARPWWVAGLALIGVASVSVVGVASARNSTKAEPIKAYYTTDGETLTELSAGQFSPIKYNGKDAYRAYVFRCGQGKPYINHVERLTKGTDEKLAAATRGNSASYATIQKAVMEGREVANPKTKQWVKLSAGKKAVEIMTPKCPDGSAPVAVEPQGNH